MSKPCLSRSALVASAVAIAAAGVLAACGGGTRTHAGSTAAGGRPQPAPDVVVAISSRPSGHSLPPAFVGLAVEDWTLTKNQFAHTNLGPVPADARDRRDCCGSAATLWTRASGPRGTTPAGLGAGDRHPGVVAGSRGGPAGHGLAGDPWRQPAPLRPGSRGRRGSHAARILGARLAAIEIGNEPDHYGIPRRATARFRRYARALRAAVPGVGLAGPTRPAAASAG